MGGNNVSFRSRHSRYSSPFFDSQQDSNFDSHPALPPYRCRDAHGLHQDPWKKFKSINANKPSLMEKHSDLLAAKEAASLKEAERIMVQHVDKFKNSNLKTHVNRTYFEYREKNINPEKTTVTITSELLEKDFSFGYVRKLNNDGYNQSAQTHIFVGIPLNKTVSLILGWFTSKAENTVFITEKKALGNLAARSDENQYFQPSLKIIENQNIVNLNLQEQAAIDSFMRKSQVLETFNEIKNKCLLTHKEKDIQIEKELALGVSKEQLLAAWNNYDNANEAEANKRIKKIKGFFSNRMEYKVNKYLEKFNLEKPETYKKYEVLLKSEPELQKKIEALQNKKNGEN